MGRSKNIRQSQLVRLEIVSELYRRGYTYREIRKEVMARLNLDTYSLETVFKDVNRLLAEWQEYRIENLDHAVQLELERINEMIKEAWAAWEKSKNDYTKKRYKHQGKPGGKDGKDSPAISKIEQLSDEVVCYGDLSYLEFINKCLMERRKLLGLYSPEKKEITGDLTFANLLMQTGVIDAAE